MKELVDIGSPKSVHQDDAVVVQSESPLPVAEELHLLQYIGGVHVHGDAHVDERLDVLDVDDLHSECSFVRGE